MQRIFPLSLFSSHADKEANGSKTALFTPHQPIPIDIPRGTGLKNLKKRASATLASHGEEITPLEGLVQEGDLILLVTPIDLAAPKGRLILPQVETIRDALDQRLRYPGS
jgi:predicted GTPase